MTIAAMSGPAEMGACHERLHRSGWSIGEVGTSSAWLVTGTNGENVLRPVSRTLAKTRRQVAGARPTLYCRVKAADNQGRGNS
jgi:hypothetical protein